MRNKVFSITLLFLLISLFCSSVFAASGYSVYDNADSTYNSIEDIVNKEQSSTVTVDNGTIVLPQAEYGLKATGSTQHYSEIYGNYADTLPDVSINDLIRWSNAKGAEVIHFLQTFIEPFAVIIFMLGAIMTMIGAIGNGQMAGKGFSGMVMSIICYAACLYAPSILSWSVAWLGTI